MQVAVSPCWKRWKEPVCVCVCVRERERDHHGVTQGGVYGRAEEGRAIERHLFLP